MQDHWHTFHLLTYQCAWWWGTGERHLILWMCQDILEIFCSGTAMVTVLLLPLSWNSGLAGHRVNLKGTLLKNGQGVSESILYNEDLPLEQAGVFSILDHHKQAWWKLNTLLKKSQGYPILSISMQAPPVPESIYKREINTQAKQ